MSHVCQGLLQCKALRASHQSHLVVRDPAVPIRPCQQLPHRCACGNTRRLTVARPAGCLRGAEPAAATSAPRAPACPPPSAPCGSCAPAPASAPPSPPRAPSAAPPHPTPAHMPGFGQSPRRQCSPWSNAVCIMLRHCYCEPVCPFLVTTAASATGRMTQCTLPWRISCRRAHHLSGRPDGSAWPGPKVQHPAGLEVRPPQPQLIHDLATALRVCRPD